MFKLGDIIELDDFESESDEPDSYNCFWSYGDKSMLKNDLVIKDELGSGGYGSVYDLHDENLVIKIIEDSGYSEHLEQLKEYIEENNINKVSLSVERNYFLNDVKREVKYQNLAYNRIKDINGAPITPKVIAACVCKSKNNLTNVSTKIGIIIMEKIKGITMSNLFPRNKHKYNISVNNLISIREQIINIISQLKKNNFVHGDMLRENIIINNIDTRPVVNIIDWGQATTVELYPYSFSKRYRKKVKLEDPTWKDIKLLDKIIEKKAILLEMKNNAIEKLNKIFEKRKITLDSGRYKNKIVKSKYSRKKCPRGSISRKGYTYVKKSTGKRIRVRVKSSCIKSKSLRSRGKKSKRVLPKLKNGSLTKYGYSTSVGEKKRHVALKKAQKAYGYSTLVKKLNAVKLLTKNTSPKNSRIYGRDLKWIQRSRSTA